MQGKFPMTMIRGCQNSIMAMAMHVRMITCATSSSGESPD